MYFFEHDPYFVDRVPHLCVPLIGNASQNASTSRTPSEPLDSRMRTNPCAHVPWRVFHLYELLLFYFIRGCRTILLAWSGTFRFIQLCMWFHRCDALGACSCLPFTPVAHFLPSHRGFPMASLSRPLRPVRPSSSSSIGQFHSSTYASRMLICGAFCRLLSTTSGISVAALFATIQRLYVLSKSLFTSFLLRWCNSHPSFKSDRLPNLNSSLIVGQRLCLISFAFRFCSGDPALIRCFQFRSLLLIAIRCGSASACTRSVPMLQLMYYHLPSLF